MSKSEKRYFACDFETTVYDNQDFTCVWSAASVELGTEEVHIQGSIEDFFKYIFSLQGSLILYFHNLKFDGSFILPYLIMQGYQQALSPDNKFLPPKEMPRNSFTYTISDMGQWYTIKIKNGDKKLIEIRDSLKLLPFSLRAIGKSFNTKHQKLEMDYAGFRYPNCPISDKEKAYIENDVLVLKEALEMMFADGHNKLTIGACCLQEFKNTLLLNRYSYDRKFPNLFDIELNQERFGVSSVGEFCRMAYKGGWCYLKRGCENKLYTQGCTNDVNSLYPSMMHSESGNYYPIGEPTLWHGNYIPEEAKQNNNFYFIKIITAFEIKDKHLPCIQIKRDARYKGNEWLETSAVFYKGKYFHHIKAPDGSIIENRVTLYLTMVDWELIQKHYHLIDCEIVCGMYFNTEIGIFDKYIDHYKEIKQTSKGAKRAEAKLFLNNLYGKMASSPDSPFKIAAMNELDILTFTMQEAHDKKPGYIAIGAAITAYARRFTITAAQENYEHFVYADTDSIHCNCKPNEVLGIKVHPVNFCCWKTESTWNQGLFVRQKTYIEHVYESDLEPCEPFYTVKAAGMPTKSNYLLEKSLEYNLSEKLEISEDDKITMKIKDSEIEWIKQKRSITDFKIGLVVPGALKQKRIKGGVVLYEKEHTLR